MCIHTLAIKVPIAPNWLRTASADFIGKKNKKIDLTFFRLTSLRKIFFLKLTLWHRTLRFSPLHAQCIGAYFVRLRHLARSNCFGAIQAQRQTFTFFHLTPVAKNIFYKINPLTWKDAVSTVASPVYLRTFLVSGIISLGRTVSAQFKLKVTFCTFLTDPPYVRATLNAFSRSLILDWRIPAYAAYMGAWRYIGANLLVWTLNKPGHF